MASIRCSQSYLAFLSAQSALQIKAKLSIALLAQSIYGTITSVIKNLSMPSSKASLMAKSQYQNKTIPIVTFTTSMYSKMAAQTKILISQVVSVGLESIAKSMERLYGTQFSGASLSSEISTQSKLTGILHSGTEFISGIIKTIFTGHVATSAKTSISGNAFTQNKLTGIVSAGTEFVSGIIKSIVSSRAAATSKTSLLSRVTQQIKANGILFSGTKFVTGLIAAMSRNLGLSSQKTSMAARSQSQIKVLALTQPTTSLSAEMKSATKGRSSLSESSIVKLIAGISATMTRGFGTISGTVSINAVTKAAVSGSAVFHSKTRLISGLIASAARAIGGPLSLIFPFLPIQVRLKASDNPRYLATESDMLKSDLDPEDELKYKSTPEDD
jgi:hypothetical protein